MKNTHEVAIQFSGFCIHPKTYGPGRNSISDAYRFRAKITAVYDKSRHGAVMLKIATMVCVEPIPMQLRAMLKTTTSQTALTGVLVRELTWDHTLTLLI